jgi:presenilin-like A22 family membrane protease
MFLLAQIIGLAVIHAYSPRVEYVMINGTLQNLTIEHKLPYGMQPPEVEPQVSFMSIILAILMATALIFLLSRIKARIFLKAWFFVVVLLSMGISLNAFLLKLFTGPTALLALIIALPLAVYKIFEGNLVIHNLTELLIYPGIAAIFVPLLNIWFAFMLLIAISLYDIYAVWHAKFMQKLAMFQIKQLRVFTGFFIPYVTKKDVARLKKLRSLARKKGKKEAERRLKKARIKVNLAILGGGDITFPLIFTGVILRATGLLPALLVSLATTISLFVLFISAKKGKFYPAMPFLTGGCIAGWLLGLLV